MSQSHFHTEHQGQRATFDFAGNVVFERWLNGPIFEPLKTPQHFARMFVEGGDVAWPNGADIAPETLYEAAVAERSNRRLQPTAAVRETREEYKPSRRGRG